MVGEGIVHFTETFIKHNAGNVDVLNFNSSNKLFTSNGFSSLLAVAKSWSLKIIHEKFCVDKVCVNLVVFAISLNFRRSSSSLASFKISRNVERLALNTISNVKPAPMSY